MNNGRDVLEQVDVDFRGRGTRFLLYPQTPVLTGFGEPEIVWVSPPAGEILPGPADDRMYVADAIDKREPYDYPYLPPYDGPVRPPVLPGPDGHFDHLEVGSIDFQAAHMYGTLRLVLDVWQAYFGRRIEWHFRDTYERLELVPWVNWNNAQCGYGFIEMGYRRTANGLQVPMALNFDVLAHELGHGILYSEIGLPAEGEVGAQYVAFHESASDLVAIITALHFDTIIDLLLEGTSGNLYVRNILNRVGETSPTEQIRLASNRLRMSDVPDVRTPVEQLSQPERHRLGEPLTGAVFDVLVEVFQQNLVDGGAIDPELDALSRRGIGDRAHLAESQRRFDEAFRASPTAFKQALVNARDFMGLMLANAWRRLRPNLTFVDVGSAMMRADLELTGGYYHPEMFDSLVWREIGQ